MKLTSVLVLPSKNIKIMTPKVSKLISIPVFVDINATNAAKLVYARYPNPRRNSIKTTIPVIPSGLDQNDFVICLVIPEIKISSKVRIQANKMKKYCF